jgi:hypothetical protein
MSRMIPIRLCFALLFSTYLPLCGNAIQIRILQATTHMLSSSSSSLIKFKVEGIPETLGTQISLEIPAGIHRERFKYPQLNIEPVGDLTTCYSLQKQTTLNWIPSIERWKISDLLVNRKDRASCCLTVHNIGKLKLEPLFRPSYNQEFFNRLKVDFLSLLKKYYAEAQRSLLAENTGAPSLPATDTFNTLCEHRFGKNTFLCVAEDVPTTYNTSIFILELTESFMLTRCLVITFDYSTWKDLFSKVNSAFSELEPTNTHDNNQRDEQEDDDGCYIQ